jgi:hypothetical protein
MKQEPDNRKQKQPACRARPFAHAAKNLLIMEITGKLASLLGILAMRV